MRSTFSGAVVLAFSMVLTVALPAFAGLQWLEPLPQGNLLKDVEFLDESTAIAAGSDGTAMVSHDGGVTWSISTLEIPGQPLPLGDVLFGLARVDATTAIALGGSIHRTTDGAANWATGAQLDATDIDFLGNLGFVTTDQGALRKIERSTDGGQTWSVVYSAVAALSAIDVISPTIIVAAGRATFVRSLDGGDTWTALPFSVPDPYSPRSISFIDDLHGAIAVGSDRLYVTTDGGATWTERVLDPVYGGADVYVFASKVEMLDPNTLLVAGENHSWDPGTGARLIQGQFLRTTDGGITWESDFGARPFQGLARNQAGKVLLVGDGGIICRWTATDGIVQVAGSHEITTEDGGSCAFLDSNHGIVIASRVASAGTLAVTPSVILRTSDGGQTWSSAQLASTHLTDVAITTAGAYAVGSQIINGVMYNVLLKSLDGGQTWGLVWSAALASMSNELKTIAFGSASHGVAIGKRGACIVIDNDTVTPASTSPAFGDCRDVAMSGQFAVAVVTLSGRGYIFQSGDGGMHWTEVANPAPHSLSAVAFVSSQVCVAAGDRFIRSDDAGLTWVETPIQEFHVPNVYAITFTGSHGMAVGAFGQWGSAFESTDGGQSWNELFTAAAPFAGVAFVDPFRAIISGPNEILKYTNTVATPVTPVPAAALQLLPNQPNPFNPVTTIRFVVPARARVRVSVYDVAGRYVTTLLDEVRDAGMHSVQWNGTDARGGRVASGVYLGRLESGKASVTRKMVLLK